MNIEDKFIEDVRAELKRAREKFPGDRIMTIALAEEFGELAKAMLDEPGHRVWKEAIQTAVMAARVAIDGDSSVDSWRRSRGLDDHRNGGHGTKLNWPAYCDYCGAPKNVKSTNCSAPFGGQPHRWTGEHPADKKWLRKMGDIPDGEPQVENDQHP